LRRIVPVIAATAGSLALLANFHTSPGGGSVVAGTGPQATTTPTTDAPPRSTSTSPPVTGSAPPTTAAGRRNIDGPVVANRYGDVQVRVVLVGHQIVDLQALKLPSDRSRSVSISNEAGPLLRREALQAQSAQIHLVSGASYTSESYVESLQGALDHANR